MFWVAANNSIWVMNSGIVPSYMDIKFKSYILIFFMTHWGHFNIGVQVKLDDPTYPSNPVSLNIYFDFEKSVFLIATSIW